MTFRTVSDHVVEIADADGVRYRYVFEATSRKRAISNAQAWAAQTDWGAVVVSAHDSVNQPGHRRILVAAGLLLMCASVAALLLSGLSGAGALGG